jgi:hypothetical protein
MEHWWNDSDRGNLTYSVRKLSQCYFVHHKSHMNCPGIEPDPHEIRCRRPVASFTTLPTVRNITKVNAVCGQYAGFCKVKHDVCGEVCALCRITCCAWSAIEFVEELYQGCTDFKKM